MVEYLQERSLKLLKEENKRLKEQLLFAIKFGNKITALGVPLMARTNNRRKEKSIRDFSTASAEWWKFVAATNALKDGKLKSANDLMAFKKMISTTNIKYRIYEYNTFIEISAYDKGVNIYFHKDGRFASIGHIKWIRYWNVL